MPDIQKVLSILFRLALRIIFFLFQILSPCTDEDSHLHVPPLEKQFLISPPASPPVGWEQPKEDKPVVDYDLLSAMASLSPGEFSIIPIIELTVVEILSAGPTLVWVLQVLQDSQFLNVWVLPSMMVCGNFSSISIIFHKNCLKNDMNLVIPCQKEISSTQSLEFLTGAL